MQTMHEPAHPSTSVTSPTAEAPLRNPPLSLSRRLLRSAFRVGAVMLVLLALARWTGLVERVAFFHPGTADYATPAGCEEVEFSTPDGMTLHGWFMPAKGLAPGTKDAPAPAVLHCHGNMGDISAHASTSAYITQAGVSVFLFDYRGFGKSTPASMLSRDDLLTDSEAAYAYLRTRKDVDASRIGVFGYSLGGVYALALAAKHPEIKCVTSVATFCSWPCVASDHVPVLGRLLIATGLAAEDSAAAMGQRPLLLVHGDRDTIVSFAHGPRILEAAMHAHVPAELLKVPGAGHLNLFTKETKLHIREFFAKSLGTAP